jgi:predicted ATP-binding protein involved in virulence
LEKIIKYLLKDVEYFNLWGTLNPHDKVHILSYLTRVQNPETRVHITWLNPYEDNLLAWVMDLFIQYARVTGQVPDPATMGGIVVLEQFDLHCISPEGSSHLRDQILKTFPKMQFFVTSRFGNEIPPYA